MGTATRRHAIAFVVAIGVAAGLLSTPATAAAVSPSPRPVRIAVVILRFPDTPPAIVTTPSTAQRVVFGATNSVAAWLREVSDNAVSASGEVFGPFDSPLAKGKCENYDWDAAGKSVLASIGRSHEEFDHIVIASPSDGVCPYAGIAVVGGKTVRLNGAFNVGVIVHELGHNFNQAHAGAIACSGGYTGGTCTRSNDPLDPMGSAAPAKHYSAFRKYNIGWLPAAEVKSVTAGSQVIPLVAHELRSALSTQLILIPLANGMKYAIERRANFGFDQGTAGVWIRRLRAPGSSAMGSDDAQLLDMTPGSAGGFTDANLAPGATFVDAANNVTVRNLDERAAASVLQVCIGPCGATPSIVPIVIGTISSTAHAIGTAGADRMQASFFGTNVVEISTGGWPITIAPGCIELMARAFCNASTTALNGGPGDDQLSIAGSLRGSLYGHYGNDTLVGGTGADLFSGGPGTDTVDYSTRVGEHITGTPGTGYDDGRPGEGDNIMGDVEQVRLPN